MIESLSSPSVKPQPTVSFPEFVSWLLQMALSSEGRADHLYEYCKDDKIADACAQLGFKRTSLWIVRLTQEGLCHIKAVGVNGKRSAILAVVVACLLCEVICHKAFLEKVCRENPSLHEPLMSLIRRITSERQWRDERSKRKSSKREEASEAAETNVNRHAAEATENRRSRKRKRTVRRWDYSTKPKAGPILN